MRTRKNPCPADKAWLENHKSQECEREADPDGSSQINGVCPEESADGELRKSRNGKKQRKRKRSPKFRSGGGGDSRPEFLLGMAAERVWFDKPLYDRAENIYREKLLDSRSGEGAGIPQIPEEFPRDSGAKSNAVLPKAVPKTVPKAFPRCSHGNFSACHHVLQGVWLNKPEFDRAEGTFMEKSQLFPPPALLVLPSPGWNSGLGTPDEGYGTALPTPALPSSAIPAFPASQRPPVNGKPQIPNWEALVAAEAWLEKPLYDSAERNFYERMFSRHSRPENNREAPQKNGKRGEIPGIPEDVPACFFLHRDSESVWLHKLSYDRAESRFFSVEASRAAGIRESPLGNPSPAPGMK
ncbi:eukaryotic translation elongation factor 1 delta [Pitangus sulphuratus]|nr:eukaryotic translation elongation factor 1 delta [Pitangus sulphuratus]